MAFDSPGSPGGEPMALLVLSDRLRGELQDIVSHTPVAKERCRAQALLGIADGSDVGEVAEVLLVSRQTVYNWLSRFQERAELDLRARLLDAPRLGRPRTASGSIDELVAAVIDGDPRTFGYHATVWTAPLLSRYLRNHHAIHRRIVSRASGHRHDATQTTSDRNQPGPPTMTNANPDPNIPRLSASRAGALALLAMFVADVPLRAEEAVLTADFAVPAGSIRPLH